MANSVLKSTKPRFILRHVKLADATAFFECQQDKESKRNFMSTPKDIKKVRASIMRDILEYKKKNPHFEDFAIEVDGKCVGFIWLGEISYGFFKHRASIGYCVHKDFRGKGIGSKAIKLVTDHAFKKYKLKRIYTYTRTFNKGSRKALEKAGYKCEGILKKNKFKDRKYLDDCIYAKVK